MQDEALARARAGGPWVRVGSDLGALAAQVKLARSLGLQGNSERGAETQKPFCARVGRHGNGRVVGFGSKLDAVVRELRELKRRDPAAKSLVFSQWADALLLLREALAVNSIASLVLTGGEGAVETLRRFRESTDATASSAEANGPGPTRGGAAALGGGSVQVLLMPLKATNAGLSINEATHVFLLDTGLDRGLEIQALARVRRINSTSPTTVHRVIMQETIEEAIWELLRPGHQAPPAAASPGAPGPSGGAAAAVPARPVEVRRCDVYAMLRRLRTLFQANSRCLGPRPGWRRRILEDLASGLGAV